MSKYAKELASRRKRANRQKARERSLKSGKGCLACPASAVCLSGKHVVITRCASCGAKTVILNDSGDDFILVGSDIECWAVDTTTYQCDACMGRK